MSPAEVDDLSDELWEAMLNQMRAESEALQRATAQQRRR
jgi:hypothetical protein